MFDDYVKKKPTFEYKIFATDKIMFFYLILLVNYLVSALFCFSFQKIEI